MKTQAEKAVAFRALHQREGAFIIPNPWDAGTARLLAGLGFEALASTSAGCAFSLGQRDGTVGRERMLRHVADLAAATELPLSGDLENGYGRSPQDAAETYRLAAQAGLVGASIEDAASGAVYELSLAVERVQAAVEAVRALPFPFTLTARAENYLLGRRDLDDTIRRLQAYQAAGADVLFAPGISEASELAALVRAVDRPVNALMTAQLDLATLQAAGVKRVSVGGALTRAAFGAFLRAARELRTKGTFSFAADAVSFNDLSALFDRDRGTPS